MGGKVDDAGHKLEISVALCPDPNCGLIHLQVEGHPQMPHDEIFGLPLSDATWDWLFKAVAEKQLERKNVLRN